MLGFREKVESAIPELAHPNSIHRQVSKWGVYRKLILKLVKQFKKLTASIQNTETKHIQAQGVSPAQGEVAQERAGRSSGPV